MNKYKIIYDYFLNFSMLLVLLEGSRDDYKCGDRGIIRFFNG